MAVNPDYENIGKNFVQEYYALFDDSATRARVASFYSATESVMSFEGHQIQGASKIMEKILELNFKKIERMITSLDAQPTMEGGVLITVLGRLLSGGESPIDFSQGFILKANGNSFFVAHDICRLSKLN